MSGQVDKAGREAREGDAERLAAARERLAQVNDPTAPDPYAAVPVSRELTVTDVTKALDLAYGHRSDFPWPTVRWLIEQAHERDRLAGQVAAIRALADAWTKRSAPNASSAYQDCSTDIRAALVASSPTTPGATK